jgi:hypothetical protein
MLIGLPIYAIYDVVMGVVAILFYSSYSYYTAGAYFVGAVYNLIWWVTLPLLFL